MGPKTIAALVTTTVLACVGAFCYYHHSESKPEEAPEATPETPEVDPAN